MWDHVAPVKVDHEGNGDAAEDETEGDAAQDQGPSESKEAVENTQTTPEIRSFKDTMLAVKDSVPNNVSVSYFFICMLHLANEKVGLPLIN